MVGGKTLLVVILCVLGRPDVDRLVVGELGDKRKCDRGENGDEKCDLAIGDELGLRESACGL